MMNYPLVLNALIVLGHDGWLNASVWESDVLSSEKMRAVLYIQKPDDELTPFERKFRARNNTCQMQSQWGSPSLVHITNELLTEALEKFPNCRNFWIISGTSIPVATAAEFPLESETLFESGPTNSFYIHNGNIFLDKRHEASNRLFMPRCELRRIQDRIPGFFSGQLTYHSQWCRLSRVDAMVVSSFTNYASFRVIDDFLSNQDIHKYLVGRVVREGCRNAVMAPDECYYGIVIAMHYGRKTVSAGPPCSWTIFQKCTDHSPLTFTQFDATVWQECNQHGELVALNFKLRDAIKACRSFRESIPCIKKSLMTLRKCRELPWNGQGLLEIVDSCQAVVIGKGGLEPMSAACASEKSSKGEIISGQKHHVSTKKRQAVRMLQTFFPNHTPEEMLAKRNATGKRQKKKLKREKLREGRLASKSDTTDSAK